MDVAVAGYILYILQTPAKRHAPETTFSPVTGTRLMSPVHTPKDHFKAKGKTDNPSKKQRPLTDAEKLHALRSEIEGSVTVFKKTKQKLEKILSTEGSSELKTFFSRGSADLQTELCRHRELGRGACRPCWCPACAYTLGNGCRPAEHCLIAPSVT
ncbi:uncharacterized protein si:dkey-148h10.5 [Megalops cyprinoides]|uniref:uncharacterized protein si:dkey-148h10.5 n=1 Tax=Megalops cyprinoides TaxID=118141 RepID=UPI00186419CC|nr:uncharacterized protein si:dkey-148h10.5 [Megalops cyprinoides]